MLKKQRIQADANSARLETHHDSHVQSAPLPAHRPGHSTNHALGLTYPATNTFPTPTHAGRCMWCCSCHAAEFWGGVRGGRSPPPPPRVIVAAPCIIILIGTIPQHQLQPLGLAYPTLITTLPSAGGAARMASWDRGILLPPSRSCTILMRVS
jgi:hypothetical protein